MAVPENKRVSLERSFISGRCPALQEESGTIETRNFHPAPEVLRQQKEDIIKTLWWNKAAHWEVAASTFIFMVLLSLGEK